MDRVPGVTEVVDDSIEVVTRPVAALVDATGHGDRAALAKLISLVETGGDGRADALAALSCITAPGTLRSSASPARRAQGSRRSPTSSSPASAARRPRSACSPSTRRARSAAAPSSATASACRTTPPTTACSSARWPRAATSAGCRSPRPRRCACSTPPGRRGSSSRPSASARSRSRSRAADTTIVVVNPGWGDGVQASKAGLLEIADVFVVNKADRGGTDATVRDLQGMLMLGEHRDWSPPDRPDGRHRRPRPRRARRRHRRAPKPSGVVRGALGAARTARSGRVARDRARVGRQAGRCHL